MDGFSNCTRPCYWWWCSLVEDFPQGLNDCRNPALGLEELLRQRSKELQGKEESQVIHVPENQIVKLDRNVVIMLQNFISVMKCVFSI